MKITITFEDHRAPNSSTKARRPNLRHKPDRRVIRTREIAERLGVPASVVRDMAARGDLPTPTTICGWFEFDRPATQRAIVEIRKRHAKARRYGYPSERPLPRWGGRAAKLDAPLTTLDVARILGVDPQTVRESAKRGEIECVWKRNGQLWFDRDAIRRFIFERNRRRAQRAQTRLLRMPKGGA